MDDMSTELAELRVRLQQAEFRFRIIRIELDAAAIALQPCELCDLQRSPAQDAIPHIKRARHQASLGRRSDTEEIDGHGTL